ncbi:MAG: zf-TFIIB domain-containing protein [Planctomycetes bacterium]|nr:zf-TFIIB domain-containing protein [Planctomycetota bacterium]
MPALLAPRSRRRQAATRAPRRDHGRTIADRPDPRDPAPMSSSAGRCPACTRCLREVEHRGVRIDACDCGGVWFDAGEVEAWTRRARPLEAREQATPTEGGGSPPCPRCQDSRLTTFMARALAFAACTRCKGIWLPAATVASLDPIESDPSDADWLLPTVQLLGSWFEKL